MGGGVSSSADSPPLFVLNLPSKMTSFLSKSSSRTHFKIDTLHKACFFNKYAFSPKPGCKLLEMPYISFVSYTDERTTDTEMELPWAFGKLSFRASYLHRSLPRPHT